MTKKEIYLLDVVDTLMKGYWLLHQFYMGRQDNAKTSLYLSKHDNLAVHALRRLREGDLTFQYLRRKQGDILAAYQEIGRLALDCPLFPNFNWSVIKQVEDVI